MDQFKFLQAVNNALRNLGTSRLIAGHAPYVSITLVDRGSIHSRLCVARFVFEGDSPVLSVHFSKIVEANQATFKLLEHSHILKLNRCASKNSYGAKFPTTDVSGDQVVIAVSGPESFISGQMVNLLARELIDTKQIVNITPM